MKNRTRLFMLMFALMICVIAIPAYATDDLSTSGAFLGLEGHTKYLRVDTRPETGATYKVAIPAAQVSADYGTDVYSLGISGGLASPEVRKAFDQFGDAKDTVPTFGASVKVVPIKIGVIKIGAVADATYVGKASDSVDGDIGGIPLTAEFDFGSMLLWSAGVVAQAQIADRIALYAGEKYTDLRSSATMRVSIPSVGGASEMRVRLKQMENLVTVFGVSVKPTDRMRLIAQGEYMEGASLSVAAKAQYIFQ